jgi:hypothetical protein
LSLGQIFEIWVLSQQKISHVLLVEVFLPYDAHPRPSPLQLHLTSCISIETHSAALHLPTRQFLSSSFCPLLPTLTATTSSKDTSRDPAFLVAHVQPLWTSLYVSSQRIALNVNGTACTEEHFAPLVPSIVVAR